MRTAIRLGSGHPDHVWAARSIYVADGGKAGNTVRLAVWRVG